VNGRFVFGSIAFSPDGLWLATGVGSGQVALWDPLSVGVVANIGAHRHYVYTVGFGADSRTLLTGGVDGVCYQWDLRPREKTADKDAAGLWNDLVGEDGAAAYRAMWSLSATPERAVTLLAEKTWDWGNLSADDARDEQSTAVRRVVSVLSQTGTPDAIRLLKKWATENPHSLLGLTAAETLKRASP
jgi:hypothetical protein